MDTPGKGNYAGQQLYTDWSGTASILKHVEIRDEKSGNSYIGYIVSIHPDDELMPEWTVLCRYSQFADLYSKMTADTSLNYKGLSDYIFPRKSMFHNSDMRTITRRISGFNELLKIALSTNTLSLFIIDFLKVKDHTAAVDSITPLTSPVTTPDARFSVTTPVLQKQESMPSVSLLNEFEPLEFTKALIRILRVEATKLKDVEVLGKNDAFVTLAFDKYRGRTKTIDGAGRSASWSTAGNSSFEFGVTMEDLMSLQLKVGAYDDNDLSSATLIGQGEGSLATAITCGMDCEVTINIELRDSKKHFAGNVAIIFELVEHPELVAKELTKTHEGGIIFALFYIVFYSICRIIFLVATFDYRRVVPVSYFIFKRNLFRIICYSQIVLFCGALFVYFHRILGFVLTKFVASIMQPEKYGGAFNMTFGWLSFRLGLDESEIVLKDFRWHNTPGYKESPYFVHIKRLCIRFSLDTLLSAFSNNSPVKVSDIDIDGVTLYIERMDGAGLNLWACLGSGNQKDSGIEGAVVGSVTSAMANKGIDKDSKDTLNSDHNDSERDYKSESNTNAQSTSLNSKSGLPEDDQDDYLVSGDGRSRSASEQKPGKLAKKQSSETALNAGGTVKTSAWGVPFRFLVNRLQIRNLRAYAHDYLNARHSAYSPLNVIVVRHMDMGHKDFLDQKHPAKGIWLDDVVWRLVGELINTLLTANSGSLALLAASAALNNMSAAAINTTAMASRGLVSSIHNYNPAALLRTSYKKTSSFITNYDIKQDDEIQQLGFKYLCVKIISVSNVKRKGARVDYVYCVVSLTGDSVPMSGTHSTYVRSCDSEFRATFNESFTLGPLVSMSQGVSIKLFDKRIGRILTDDKCVAEAILPTLSDISVFGQTEEKINLISLKSDSLFEDTGDIQIGFMLKKS